jgi:hypothetical protein
LFFTSSAASVAFRHELLLQLLPFPLSLNVKAQYKEVLNTIDIDNTIALLEKTT